MRDGIGATRIASFRAPRTFNIDIRTNVITPSIMGPILIDINNNSNSIFPTTKLRIGNKIYQIIYQTDQILDLLQPILKFIIIIFLLIGMMLFPGPPCGGT